MSGGEDKGALSTPVRVGSTVTPVDDDETCDSGDESDDESSHSSPSASSEDESDVVAAEVIDDDGYDENMVTATTIENSIKGIESNHHTDNNGNEQSIPSSIVLSATGLQKEKAPRNSSSILSPRDNFRMQERKMDCSKTPQPCKEKKTKKNVKRGKWTLGPRIGKGAFGSVHTCMTESGSVVRSQTCLQHGHYIVHPLSHTSLVIYSLLQPLVGSQGYSCR